MNIVQQNPGMHVCMITVLCAHMSEDSIIKRLEQRSPELFCLEIVDSWLERVEAAYDFSANLRQA